jgi:hypothetical protein
MRTPTALSCTFDKIIPSDAGYVVYGECEVGRAREPSTLMLTMTGRAAARSMTVSGGPFNDPVALAQCAPPAGAQAAASSAPTGG